MSYVLRYDKCSTEKELYRQRSTNHNCKDSCGKTSGYKNQTKYSEVGERNITPF